MTDEALRWGIAGTGSIATQMVEALDGLADAEVVRVGSRTDKRAAAFAAEHAIGASGSYDALFTDDGVDIIYVASPHSEHEAMTIAALEAGRHVLCEKAFALNAGQAQAMVDAARREKRFLMEAMWTWFIPAIVDLKKRIKSGAIGDVRAIYVDFSLAVPGSTGRHRELEQGGGATLDLGIYPVAFSRYLLGAPTEVRAVGKLGPTGVDANVGGLLGHDDGAVTIFHTGLDALSTLGATIIGTEGQVTVDGPFWCTNAFSITRNDGDGDRVEIPSSGLAHEAAHAMARIRSGFLESDVIPLSETIAVMETLDEIRSQIGLTYPMERQ